MLTLTFFIYGKCRCFTHNENIKGKNKKHNDCIFCVNRFVSSNYNSQGSLYKSQY